MVAAGLPLRLEPFAHALPASFLLPKIKSYAAGRPLTTLPAMRILSLLAQILLTHSLVSEASRTSQYNTIYGATVEIEEWNDTCCWST